MKQILLTLTALSLILSACGNQKKGQKGNPEVSITTTTMDNSSDSEKLTTAMFIQKVWDYKKKSK